MLVRTGRVEETIWLGVDVECQLTYALELSDCVTEATLRYAQAEIVVSLPSTLAAEWHDTGRIGIYAVVDLGSRGLLELVLEKDFACLDRSDEDNLDTFPNPLAGAIC